MRLPFFSAFFLLSFLVFSQNDNLVLDPGFEQTTPGQYGPCSYCKNDRVFDQALADWKTFGGMTPDLIIWDSTGFGNCFFPKPHSGDHAVGLITYLPHDDFGRIHDFHEIIAGNLRTPLTPGKRYNIEFFVLQSKATAIDHLKTMYGERQDIRPTAANNLGVAFTYSPLRYFALDEIQPQFVVDEPIVTAEDEWLRITGSFVPDRAFLYFAIGNFSKDHKTTTTIEAPAQIDSINAATPVFTQKIKRIAYYVLDDIRIWPAEEKPAPSIGTELKKNKIYTFQNVNFETAKWDLQPEALPELRALSAFLKDNLKVKIEIGGHTDDVGGEEDNRLLSEKRAESVYKYLTVNGINAERLSFKGYGESQPVAKNDTQEGRLENRRVECKMVNDE